MILCGQITFQRMVVSVIWTLPDLSPLLLQAEAATSSDLESSSEVTKSMTGALLILLATLVLTASDMSATTLGTACRGLATSLVRVRPLLVPGVTRERDSLWIPLASSVALSALNC